MLGEIVVQAAWVALQLQVGALPQGLGGKDVQRTPWAYPYLHQDQY